MKNSNKALTLIETIIAVVVMTIIFVALMPALSASLQQTTVAGQRSQAIKIVNYLGQRVMNRDWYVTPRYRYNSKNWDYGSLPQQFNELKSGDNISNLNQYRAEVYSAGNVGLPGMGAGQYDISVCFKKAGQEHCAKASTFGRWSRKPPAPPPGGTGDPTDPPDDPDDPDDPGDDDDDGYDGGGDYTPPEPPPYIN